MALHLHLDPVGGIAGDMFVGALLDLRPDLAGDAVAAVRAAGLDESVALAHVPFADGVLSGSRFTVDAPRGDRAHDHVHWSTLRARLAASPLAPPVRERAVDIFRRLAEAEARVHGKAVEAVAFHEVGAWDSIADVVAAAFLIDALGPASWSIGAVPVGSGRVETAHGLLPVPAPAAALLLAGLDCFDDGLPGERVTPTGAAIVRHLAPARGLGGAPRRLERSGHGFGSRRLPGLSNVLRVLAFAAAAPAPARPEQVAEIAFEIDDQSAEDLALALERLRALDGVLDVCQIPVTAKRGRLASGIRVLARPEHVDAVSAACFEQTTTLGLRLALTERLVLPRREQRTPQGVAVKIAERPGGATAKAELHDLDAGGGYRARQARRAAAESDALADEGNER